eukprot:scaffold108793_cov20-Prasinocladus_malaysianus.AAC.1
MMPARLRSGLTAVESALTPPFRNNRSTGSTGRTYSRKMLKYNMPSAEDHLRHSDDVVTILLPAAPTRPPQQQPPLHDYLPLSHEPKAYVYISTTTSRKKGSARLEAG